VSHVAEHVLKVLDRVRARMAAPGTVTSTCPLDGCLLFKEDETCPACRARLTS
jgi:hypothetical protein